MKSMYQKRFECPHCGFEAKLKTRLKQHMHEGHAADIYECPHCRYEAKRKTRMKQHMHEEYVADLSRILNVSRVLELFTLYKHP